MKEMAPIPDEVDSEYFEGLLRRISKFPNFIKDPNDSHYAGKKSLELGLEKFRRKFKMPFFDSRIMPLEKMAQKFADLGMVPNVEDGRTLVRGIGEVRVKSPYSPSKVIGIKYLSENRYKVTFF